MSQQPSPFSPTKDFAKRILAWFDINGRKDLPWQSDKTPYRVWVSEIMLQQTQVAAVIGYYQRFMEHFPDIHSLAHAEEQQVLAQWAGLGYYARARNLHKAAKHVVFDLDGAFPSDVEKIMELSGIGRSTAGAISSIAFKRSAPILDGNVKRVLTRLHDIEGWPGRREIEKQLWQLADNYTPTERCEDYTQAIMDLGATLCTRSTPQCTQCPFQTDCQAYANDTIRLRPTSKPKKKNPVKECWILDITCNNETLFEKRPASGIWGGLHSLPELSREYTYDEILEEVERRFDLKGLSIDEATPFKHIFSHYTLLAHPVRIQVSRQENSIREERLEWLTHEARAQKGLPAPISKYFEEKITKP
ncbi:hypothetical protein A3762_06035 [Oleiphilus sp. HI0125]|uniref:A/G-specific adenine glycosylase n=1 Tax=Oleiphilus sp. HI0125 TaxID=1822266 RepID=UPI0007C3862B|nr:A/G-specific adenine glycosylase [Oleiphilus sp. HI0125]KZZ59140.1 hypothetical protein A3762_06035 [Oleiphilus sp. HI0125]